MCGDSLNVLRKSFIYEIILASLVILSLVADLPKEQGFVLDGIIWVIFLLDYIVRLIMSEKKWEFIKSNPLDLIAIIPLDQIFRAVRLIRLLRVIRLISLLKRGRSFLDVVFEKYNVDKVFVFVIAFLFLSSLSMTWIEPEFDSYGDSLWWAVVTTTTVGYGDIYPQTPVGKIIASVLMFIGIGVIGVFTGTIASLFSSHHSRTEADESLPQELEVVKSKLEPNPNEDTLDEMMKQIQQLKDRKFQ